MTVPPTIPRAQPPSPPSLPPLVAASYHPSLFVTRPRHKKARLPQAGTTSLPVLPLSSTRFFGDRKQSKHTHVPMAQQAGAIKCRLTGEQARGIGSARRPAKNEELTGVATEVVTVTQKKDKQHKQFTG